MSVQSPKLHHRQQKQLNPQQKQASQSIFPAIGKWQNWANDFVKNGWWNPFSHVNISWQPRDTINTDMILNQHFQLLWNRQHFLTGLLPGFETLYGRFHYMPDYEISWFSHSHLPQLTSKFFKDKAIGLLSDPQSQSGHQLPWMQIQKHQIVIDNEQIHYYPNRSAMINDFLQGTRDLIPSIKLIPELRSWPQEQSLLIHKQAAMGDWYINKSLPNSMYCDLLLALQEWNPTLIKLARQEMAQCRPDKEQTSQ